MTLGTKRSQSGAPRFEPTPAIPDGPTSDAPYLVVLGIAQDGGYPQAGCTGHCCSRAWRNPSRRRRVACLGLLDPPSGGRWLLDCTPDFREQLRDLHLIAPPSDSPVVDGILLTHAHIGHYAGLTHLGREAMDPRHVPVYAMPRMRAFLEGSGPWSQLVAGENVALYDLAEGRTLELNERLRVTPFLVPHRSEYSETVGFRVEGPARTAVYLPDIDSWEHWGRRIEDTIAGADVAYLDGTFYERGELGSREMAEVPHPTILESIERFSALPDEERRKVRFLHLNHTNPALDPASEAANAVAEALHRIASEGERFVL